jgi:hypothetical protein
VAGEVSFASAGFTGGEHGHGEPCPDVVPLGPPTALDPPCRSKPVCVALCGVIPITSTANPSPCHFLQCTGAAFPRRSSRSPPGSSRGRCTSWSSPYFPLMRRAHMQVSVREEQREILSIRIYITPLYA